MADEPDLIPDLIKAKQEGSRWDSPLVLAFLAAAVGLAGNIWVEHANNKWSKDTDFFNVRSALVVDAIRTGNPDVACQNLRLLINLNYIQDENNAVKTQCRDVPPGPPYLPGSDKSAAKPQGSEANVQNHAAHK